MVGVEMEEAFRAMLKLPMDWGNSTQVMQFLIRTAMIVFGFVWLSGKLGGGGGGVKAAASHILVKDEALCSKLKGEINGSGDVAGAFARAAKEHSTCPSRSSGGSLGVFGRGAMVPAFDKVVFSEELGKVHGPVQTQFGFHLILITSREEPNKPKAG